MNEIFCIPTIDYILQNNTGVYNELGIIALKSM
jgi:hypothetical protein